MWLKCHPILRNEDSIAIASVVIFLVWVNQGSENQHGKTFSHQGYSEAQLSK
jgi:hypothetical protein